MMERHARAGASPRAALSLEGATASKGIAGGRQRSAGSAPSPPRDDGSVIPRIVVLAVVAVFFQAGVLSELPVFGVRVDVTPLVVAFVGYLGGSVTGAVTGFGMGLMVDLTLAQTLGLTSLIFTLIGYAAGRLREMRDPQATLMPLLLGGLATFVSLAGYSVMEFLLGVDAPVSFELLRQIVLGTVVGTLLAAPVWALTKRVLEPGLPEDPKRRRRRAYTTGGLSPLSRA
jgi:rod shape-determining protein MreD